MRVCILGSGLSCLTLAKALVNQKIYVDVKVSANSFKPRKSRTIGISKSNLEFFNKHIINIDKITWKIKQIHIFSDNLKKEKLLNFENSKNQLFSIIKNYELYNVLNKSLKKNKYFRFINLKRSSDGVTVGGMGLSSTNVLDLSVSGGSFPSVRLLTSGTERLKADRPDSYQYGGTWKRFKS